MPDGLPDLAQRAAQATLTPAEVARYARHLSLPGVGAAGQRALKAARVAVVGAGGLGAPVIQYLAAAGVGTLGIVDPDVVEESNLHRQVLFSTQTLGKPKAEAAAAVARGLNPHVRVEVHATKLTSANALGILGPYDVVVDGTDNFPARYLISDACVLLGKPDVYASIFRFEGQVSVLWPPRGPCYRCLHPQPPPPGLVPSCAEGGVLGVLPGVVGALQATEVLKLLTGAGEPLVGRLALYDAHTLELTHLQLRRHPACLACGTRAITKLIDYDAFCGVREPERAPMGTFEVAPFEAQARMAQGAMLVDVREPAEWEVARIEGAVLIPLRTLPERAGELPRDRDIIVHCHSGARSAQAVHFLRRQGFTRVWNMTGGIDAWSQLIDPGVPQY